MSRQEIPDPEIVVKVMWIPVNYGQPIPSGVQILTADFRKGGGISLIALVDKDGEVWAERMLQENE